jgi:formate hydrogenlyase subunit 3/multisubunit Na+/H+ antiporter MnhD subunit
MAATGNQNYWRHNLNKVKIMLLKIIIVILFILVVLSLSRALFFLLKDQGEPKKRVLYALGARITLAALLILCVFYGLYTGQLGSRAPWDQGPAVAAEPSEESPQNINENK